MGTLAVTLRADQMRLLARTLEQAAAGIADQYSCSVTIDNAPAKGTIDVTMPDGKKKNH
jgi:hypothetical protein